MMAGGCQPLVNLLGPNYKVQGGRQRWAEPTLRMKRVPCHRSLNLEERLPGRDIQRFLIGAAEGEVGDDVFADWNAAKQLALRGDHIDAGRHVGRFIGGSRRGDSGSDPQVAL